MQMLLGTGNIFGEIARWSVCKLQSSRKHLCQQFHDFDVQTNLIGKKKVQKASMEKFFVHFLNSVAICMLLYDLFMMMMSKFYRSISVDSV